VLPKIVKFIKFQMLRSLISYVNIITIRIHIMMLIIISYLHLV